MSAEELLKAVRKHKISLTPVLSRTKRVDFWQAGFRSVNRRSGLNFVSETGFARGKTPEEAIQKLLEGKTYYRRKRGMLVPE